MILLPPIGGFFFACSIYETPNMAIEELQTLDGCRLPTCAAAIEELYDWSLNFNAGRNPYCVYMDLIGYSYKEWGCDSYIAPPGTADSGRYSEVFGYTEYCLLGDALKIFENYGYEQVYEWCSLLNG